MEQILTASSSLFLWLVDYTRDITILICLIFLFKLIVGKKLPPWWHYCIWLILLVRMVIPWEYKNLFNISSSIPDPISDKLLNILLFDEEMLKPVLNSSVSSAGQVWNISLPDILLFSWILGALIFVVFFLINNIKFWFNIKDEPSLTDSKSLAMLKECKEKMKISNNLKIIITDKVKSPSLFGYFQPRLLLPVGIFNKLNDTELTYIFMHELGHLKHHDVGISWLMTLLQVVHWFNPLVWFAFYRIRVDQESACDEYVLSQINYNKNAEYADAIFGFLDKFCRNRRMPAMVGILENKSQIKRRLIMIVNYRKHSKKITTMAIFMLIVTGFIFFTLTGYAKEKQSNMVGREINRPTTKQWPQVKPGDKADKSRIIIGITKEGDIWIDSQKVDIASMISRMARFNKEYPDGFVVIVGDRDTRLGTAIEVLDQVRMTGITNVTVALLKND
jgi:bla regulator protein BlaR1